MASKVRQQKVEQNQTRRDQVELTGMVKVDLQNRCSTTELTRRRNELGRGAAAERDWKRPCSASYRQILVTEGIRRQRLELAV
jgi:hypothetical protein